MGSHATRATCYKPMRNTHLAYLRFRKEVFQRMETALISNQPRRKWKHPYEVKEKLKALKLLSHSNIDFVCYRYHCHPSTIYRWKKDFFAKGEKGLENDKFGAKSPHPNAHTKEEIKHIKDLIKRNPHVGLNELYGKLRENYAYSRNPLTLYKVVRKLGILDEVKKRINHTSKPYDTPLHIGEKMQLDVKVVPYECRNRLVPFDMKFYQYTIIDEASRERFLYAYNEQTADSTCDFIRRAILYFGYTPKEIQTDNGSEFTYIRETDKIHRFDVLCEQLGIHHKLIRPRTPRHNGKVERSHRNDNERFYNNLVFYSLDDLNIQMKSYLKRSNNIPMSSLRSKDENGKVIWLSPVQKRKSLLNVLSINEQINL